MGWVPPKYCTEIPNPRAQYLTVFRDEACIDLCISEDVSRGLLERALTQYVPKERGFGDSQANSEQAVGRQR